MLLLRILGLLTVFAIGSGILAYLATGNRRYLRLSGRIAKYALIFALGILMLLAAERLIVL